MRFLLTLVSVLSLFSSLSAQDNGWEISASFSPQFNKKVAPINSFREIDPDDIPISQLPSSLIDTVSVNGIERTFVPAGGADFKFNSTERNSWFGASVMLHRQLENGFSFSGGLFFNQAEYTGQASGPLTQQSVVNQSGAVLYDAYKTKDFSVGAMLQANYHLFQEKRLHPYFGMGISIARRSVEGEFVDHIYAGEVVTLERGFTTNATTGYTQTNFNFIATGGLLYRIAPKWSVGVEFTSIAGTGQGLAGIQLRRTI